MHGYQSEIGIISNELRKSFHAQYFKGHILLLLKYKIDFIKEKGIKEKSGVWSLKLEPLKRT